VLIVKDDGGIAENSKRLAQELIVNEKVNFVAGLPNSASRSSLVHPVNSGSL
jgi:ABC-type branched-subunit amino acid transport system substrate-binding protein